MFRVSTPPAQLGAARSLFLFGFRCKDTWVQTQMISFDFIHGDVRWGWFDSTPRMEHTQPHVLGAAQAPLRRCLGPGLLSSSCCQLHWAAHRRTICNKQTSLEKCYFSYYRKVENFHNILKHCSEITSSAWHPFLFRNKTTPAITGKSQTDITKPRKPFIYSSHKVLFAFFFKNYFLEARKKSTRCSLHTEHLWPCSTSSIYFLLMLAVLMDSARELVMLSFLIALHN